MASNPFAAFLEANADVATNSKRTTNVEHEFLEKVFLVSCRKDQRYAWCGLVLEDVCSNSDSQDFLTFDNLNQAVCERIMATDLTERFVGTQRYSMEQKNEALESRNLFYLFGCYCRLQNESEVFKIGDTNRQKCISAIVDNAKLCLADPEIFNMDSAKQFVDMFIENYDSQKGEYFHQFADRVLKLMEESELDTFTAILNHVRSAIEPHAQLGSSTLYPYCDLLLFYARRDKLAKIFLNHIAVQDASKGRNFETTLLGIFLSLSPIPLNDAGPFQFFEAPSRSSKQEMDIVESNLQRTLSNLNDKVYDIFMSLLKAGPECKHRFLDWLGSCLHANIGRGKIWSSQMPAIFRTVYASDGFFLNLGSVLLRICKPCTEAASPKLTKIQSTYCRASVKDVTDLKNRNIHLRDLSSDTTLVSEVEGEEKLPLQSDYTFLTECFFFAHKCLSLGFHVVNERFMNINQDLHRIQSVYRDVVAQGGDSTEQGQRIRTSMFLSLKASLTDPVFLERCFSLHIATASYLVQLASHGAFTEFKPLVFPLVEKTPIALADIPEFVAENIVDFLIFLRRFRDELFEMKGDTVSHVLDFILVFMGSPARMQNPHLRAKLAEGLEALIVPQSNSNTGLLLNFNREKLLENHPHIGQVAPVLLHVFVSIEMTGSGVEFEQKFIYRRSMYNVLQHIWKQDFHQRRIQELAMEAERDIENPQSPLFLRFVNHLINDAIFLLDEALSFMAQIREKQDAKTNGQWDDLEENQRREEEDSLRHLSMMARWHNSQANETLKVLDMITKEIKSIFVHNILVDRIAAMLNYFLLHLVGRKSKNMKVQNSEKYEFKPHEFVASISEIYLNLGDSEGFCEAVSRDGRSYSHELFVKAEKVLVKIHRPADSILRFNEIGAKVKAKAEIQTMQEEMVEGAPEEFVDPIMGTLMNEPVLLPSSGVIVDKTTISRHLLSDQFDPFNRAPLTMDKVKPENELKSRIQAWVKERMEMG